MLNFKKTSAHSEISKNSKSTSRLAKTLSTTSLLTLAALAAFSAPSSAVAQTVNGVTYAPSILSPSTTGLVSVTLQNNMTTNQPARVVTFGHVFKPGDVPAGTGLTAATAAGVNVPLAMTVKATHPDGSVRHAIISLTAPAVTKNTQTVVNLSRGAAAAAPAPIKVTDIVRPGWAPEAVFKFHSPTTTMTTLNISSLVTKAITAGTAQVWINNSLVKEVRVSTPINAQMTATFDIRVSCDGQIKTDMIIANDQAFSVTKSFVYDVAVTNKGQTLFQESNLSQYPYSNWHKELWTGTTQSNVNVAFDPEYMAKAGAIAEYDFSLGVSAQSLASFDNALAAASSGPMLSSLITPWIETTGGRADIGVTTGWAANWLVSQDQGARAVMMAQANDAGSAPWHLRDAATNAPISIDLHPTAWQDPRANIAYNSTPGDTWGSPFDTTAAYNQGGWGLDTAHEPDLSFIPYLVTGNHYYIDELESEASWVSIAGHPGYRQLGKGLLYYVDQERGDAWNLRDIANASWIAPDGDPLKATFTNNLANNMANFSSTITQLHATGAEGEIEGYMPDGSGGSNWTAPWQNGYLSMVMEQQARRGNTTAQSIAAWLDQYNSGMYTHGSQGYNPFNGPGYWLFVQTPSGAGIAPNTWPQFYNFNFGTLPVPTVLQDFVNCTYCYPAYTTMSSAQIITSTGSTQALWAYAYLVANTSVLLQPTGYVMDPSWHVTPVLPDGYHLKQTDLQVVPDSGGTVTATGAHSVLTGGLGNNVLNGGNGWTLMYASSGPAVMNVGSGTTYVVAGAGENSTSATVVVNKAVAAQETIMDFNPSFDVLQIKNSGGTMPPVSSDASGNAVLTLSANHTITLLGTTPRAVTSSWVKLL
jgi:hypothetical protein